MRAVLAFSKETRVPGFLSVDTDSRRRFDYRVCVCRTRWLGDCWGVECSLAWVLSAIVPTYGINRCCRSLAIEALTEPHDLVIASLLSSDVRAGLRDVALCRDGHFVGQDIDTKTIGVEMLVGVCSCPRCYASARSATDRHLDSQGRLNRDADALYRPGYVLIRSQVRRLKRSCRIIVTRCRRRLFGQLEDSLELATSMYCIGDSLAASLYPGLVNVFGENAIIQFTGAVMSSNTQWNDRRCEDFYDWFVD